MLLTRVVTALILASAVLAGLFLLPPRWWALALLVVVALAAAEWARLAARSALGRWLFVAGVVGAGLALVFAPAAGFAGGWPTGIVVAVCGAATLFWLLVAPPWLATRWQPAGALPLLLTGLVVLLGTFVALVELQSRSPWLALAAMAVVWIADTAAYFAGRAFGRRKLAPMISPGKTWEGVYGALAAVGLYALALTPLAARAGFAEAPGVAGTAAFVAFMLLLAALSVAGDLFESMLKRQAGVKDSGALLPGHGGVLDRIDALLAALPPAALAATLAAPAVLR
jgi:phosphatidate cytidylyltransferase